MFALSARMSMRPGAVRCRGRLVDGRRCRLAALGERRERKEDAALVALAGELRIVDRSACGCHRRCARRRARHDVFFSAGRRDVAEEVRALVRVRRRVVPLQVPACAASPPKRPPLPLPFPLPLRSRTGERTLERERSRRDSPESAPPPPPPRAADGCGTDCGGSEISSNDPLPSRERCASFAAAEELLDLAERQPVGHAVLPAVRLVVDDAGAILGRDLRERERALIAIGDVHRSTAPSTAWRNRRRSCRRCHPPRDASRSR